MAQVILCGSWAGRSHCCHQHPLAGTALSMPQHGVSKEVTATGLLCRHRSREQGRRLGNLQRRSLRGERVGPDCVWGREGVAGVSVNAFLLHETPQQGHGGLMAMMGG